jgi:hypothetical protein
MASDGSSAWLRSDLAQQLAPAIELAADLQACHALVRRGATEVFVRREPGESGQGSGLEVRAGALRTRPRDLRERCAIQPTYERAPRDSLTQRLRGQASETPSASAGSRGLGGSPLDGDLLAHPPGPKLERHLSPAIASRPRRPQTGGDALTPHR